MAIDDIGRLTAADEFLDHQIADTFASVATSDLGWTQKIWAALARKDGGMTISFGLGKYHNRNVMDGFAGISRGNEQWTVRASRRLDRDFQDISVGPSPARLAQGYSAKVRKCRVKMSMISGSATPLPNAACLLAFLGTSRNATMPFPSA